MPNAIKMDDTDPPHWIRHAKTAGLTISGAGSKITMWAIIHVREWQHTCCFLSSSVGSPITACNYWFGLDDGYLCFKMWDGVELKKYVGDTIFPAGNTQNNARLWYQKYLLVAVSYTSGGNDPELYAGLMDFLEHQTEDGVVDHGIGSTRLYYQSGAWVGGDPADFDLADDSSDYVYVGRDSAGNYYSHDDNATDYGNLIGYGIIDEHVFDKANPAGTETFSAAPVEYFELPRFIEDIDDWATNPLPAPGQFPYVWELGGSKEPSGNHNGEVIGEGNGATAQYTRTVDRILIVESSVTITAPKAGGTMTVTDDGAGNLIGDGEGDVNYETGAIDVTFDNNVTDGGTVEMAYTFHSNHQLFVFFEHQSLDWDYAIRNHCAADIFDKTDPGHGTAFNGVTPYGTAGTYDSAWHVAEHSNSLLLTEGGGALRRELPQETVPADVQCHTTAHANMSEYSREYVLGVYERLDSMYRERGLSAPRHTAYPNGNYNDHVKAWTAERRLSGRVASKPTGSGGINRYPISTDPADLTDGSGSCWFELTCQQCHQRTTGADTLAGAKTFIDSMSGTLGLYVMYTHGVHRFPFDIFHSDPSIQKELIEYAVAAGVRIVDMTEAYRLIAQEGNGTLTESLLVFTYDDQFVGAFQYAYRYLARLAGVGGTHYVSDSALQAEGNWLPGRRATYDDICAAAGLPISQLVVRFLEGGAAKTGLFPRAISEIVTGPYPGYPRVFSTDGLYQSAPHQGFTELKDGYYSMPVCGGLPRQAKVHSMNFEMADDELEITAVIPTTLMQRAFLTRELREEVEKAVRIVVSKSEVIARTLGLLHENTFADSYIFDGDKNVITFRLRAYSVAGSVGTDNDVLAAYNVTATYGKNGITSYKQVIV